jgi:peptide/nickel transport system substrate-binding protein/oligopeptide transport system substrate-binding protein
MYIMDRPVMHAMAAEIEAQLEVVGIEVSVEAIAPQDYFGRLADPEEPFDLALLGWFADYPDPFNFLNVLLHHDFDQSSSHFSDPVLDAALEHAATLVGEERVAAYRELALDLMEASPIVVLGNPNSYHFFSRRMGCQVYHPLYAINLGRLCIE